ncbi:MAG: hypothetical protein QW667_03370 [Candidatus Bathyarchaeia archaeon]
MSENVYKDIRLSLEEMCSLIYNASSADDLIEAGRRLEMLETKLRNILKHRQNDAHAIFLLASVYYQMAELYLVNPEKRGKYQDRKKCEALLEKAWRLAQQTITINKDFVEAYWLLAEAIMRLIPFKGWKFAAVHGSNAREAVLHALQLSPRNPKAYVTLGKWYLFTPEEFGGSLDRALQILQKAVELEADNHETFLIHLWLGQVFLKKQDKLKAYNEIKQALSIYPNNILAKTLADEVNELT